MIGAVQRGLSARLPSRAVPRAAGSRRVCVQSASALFATKSMDQIAAIRAMSLEGFLRRVDENNVGLEELPTLTPFNVGGKTVGQLKPKFVDQLGRFPDVFNINGLGPSGSVSLVSQVDAGGPGARTKAVAGVLEKLRDEGVITGWRSELYPVTCSFYDQPELLVERAAATQFGIKAYGIHVNGYVVGEDGKYSLWVARRSKTKPNWPGKLDHIAAGGQPHGLSPSDNVVKECEEEASIPEALARTAQPVGVISYRTVSGTGLKPDVIFCYDIRLPMDFVPKPLDGEVEEFQLWPLERVAATVSSTTEFKTNCNLVIIDFLVRHGFIGPEQPGYLSLVQRLRGGDCS